MTIITAIQFDQHCQIPTNLLFYNIIPCFDWGQCTIALWELLTCARSNTYGLRVDRYSYCYNYFTCWSVVGKCTTATVGSCKHNSHPHISLVQLVSDTITIIFIARQLEIGFKILPFWNFSPLYINIISLTYNVKNMS